MKTVREQPKGRHVDLLVCGEMLSGILCDGFLFVCIDSHTVTPCGNIQPQDVKVWSRSGGGRFVKCTYPISVYDSRPMIRFT